jgi:TRAP-type transport system small permease protein
MRIWDSIYRWIDVIRRTVIVIFFTFIVVSCFAEVIYRYIFSSSFGWVEEILRYLNIWIVLLAASIAAKRNEHLAVNYFIDILPPRYRKRVLQGVYLTIFVFLAVFIFYGTKKAILNLSQNILALPISIAWFYLAIPVGSFLMLIEYMLIFIHEKAPFHKTEEEIEL